MPVQRLSIEEFLKLGSFPVLDVRSPSEYNHAHIPGAVSFPIFSDEERKVIGTAYKQVSREEAIKIGLEKFGPRMKTIVEEAEKLVNTPSNSSSKTLLLYCWRGGMRSGAMAWLLDLYGFKVYTLAGGYKSFRTFVQKVFTNRFSFRVLGGNTGSGKTEILHQLKKEGGNVVDLEAIASHKGSAFGKFGMPPQSSQEMFENRLALDLLAASGITDPGHSSQPVWIEDESQRIGDVNIPMPLWNTIRNSPVYFLDVPFEERLNHITAEYGVCEEEKLVENIQRISKRLGPQHAKAAISLIQEKNFKEAFRILLHYYDKRYLKGLHNREELERLLHQIPCETVTVQNANFLKYPVYEKPHPRPLPDSLHLIGSAKH